jgi:thiosulfate dehydrogenase [quinone] large subunit
MTQQASKIERTSMSGGATAAAGAVPAARVEATPARSTSSARALTRETATRYVWGLTRLSLGWVFLWAFLDKTFGFGHETASAEAWTEGGSPTQGFLSGAVGPFEGVYHEIAGAAWVDSLFMVGLLTIGVALMLGIFMRLACAAGALMVILMWTASLPPANNPFMDDHVIYALVLVGLALAGAGNTLGLGRWWTQTSLVKRTAWLS